MAAKSLPPVGESYLGTDPWAMQVLKVTFGDSNQDVGINVSDTIAGALAHTVCSVAKGYHVLNIGWRVPVAFDANVDLIIGIDGDCDYFATNANIACTVVKAQIETMSGVAAADTILATPVEGVDGGYYADTANNIVVYSHKEDTNTDSGVMEVFIYYYNADTVY